LSTTSNRSVFVPLLVPEPRCAHDVVKLRIAWFPAQLADRSVRARHQHRRVTRAPRMQFSRNRVPGNSSCRLNDLADAEALAIAKIENQPIFGRGIGF